LERYSELQMDRKLFRWIIGRPEGFLELSRLHQDFFNLGIYILLSL